LWKIAIGMLLLVGIIGPSLVVPITIASASGTVEGTVFSPSSGDPDAMMKLLATKQLEGGYVVGGAAMRNLGYGTIVISGIPTGSSVVGAYLMWDTVDNAAEPDLSDGYVDGTEVLGSAVSSGPTPCWPPTKNYSYFADVTSLVSGNGSYSLSGFASGATNGEDPWGVGSPAPEMEGASLVVVYKNISSPQTVVQLYGGASETSGALLTQQLYGFDAGTSPSASTTYIVADGQSAPDAGATFDGNALAGSEFQGSDPQAVSNYSMGNLWDTKMYNVSSYVSSGDTTESTTIQGGDDCLVWVGQVFSVTGEATTTIPESSEGLGSGLSFRHPTTCAVGDPVNCASGNVSESFTDAKISGRGPGLDLTRTYNSLSALSSGMFGYGWASSYGMNLVVNGDGSVTITEEDGSQVTAEPNGSGGFVLPASADSTLTLSGGNYTFTRQETQIFSFNSSGQLTAVSDPNGYSTMLNYTSGRLATVTDSEGRTINFDYGSNGLVSEVVAPAGDTYYGYNLTDDLTSVTDPLGRVTSFGPDANHLMLTMTRPNAQAGGPDAGDNLVNVYDSFGRVVSQTDPAGLETTYSYSGDNFSSAGGTTTITDPHGNVEVQDYTSGELMSLTKGYGTSAAATWTYAYDPTSLGTTSVTDPNDRTTTSTYDTNGNLLTSSDALGNTTTYTYNTFNEPLTVTDPMGITTTHTYDANGNQLTKSVSAPGNETGPPGWSKAWIENGTSTNAVSCPITTFCVAVDQSGNIWTTTNPEGGVSTWTETTGVSAHPLYGVSCPTTSLCLAVGASGKAFYSTDPTGGSGDWLSAGTIAGTTRINAVSCVSTPLVCVATDSAGNGLISTDPTGGASHWSTVSLGFDPLAVSCIATSFSTSQCVVSSTDGGIFTSTDPIGGVSDWYYLDADGSASITSLDCPSVSLCVAGDSSGNVLASTDPMGGTTMDWPKVNVDGSAIIVGMGCASVILCVATDGSGDVLTSTNPAGGSGAWTKTELDGSANNVTAVTCPSSALCVGVSSNGSVVSSPNPAGLPIWSAASVGSGNIWGVSCPTTTMCAAVDHSGNVWTTSDPSGSASAWTETTGVSSAALYGISCPTTSLCIAVGASGKAYYSTDPTGGSSDWFSAGTIDGTTKINAVSCTSTSQCVAMDNTGNVLYTTTPTVSNSWTSHDIASTTPINAVSCPSTSLCVAVDNSGHDLYATSPTSSSWTRIHIDGSTAINAVSCPTTTLCVAVDAAGNTLTSISPTGTASAWNAEDIDVSAAMNGVSCASVSLCVATDTYGKVLTSVAPTGGANAWATDDADPSTAINAVDCPSVTLCVATDASGNILPTVNEGGTLTSTTTDTVCQSATGCPNGALTGDVESVTDPDGNVTSYGYDADGDVTSTTQTAGWQVDTTSDSYDDLGQKYCEISPSANFSGGVSCAAMGSHATDTTTWDYNADGNVTSTTDPDGNTTSYTYDADGNLTKTEDGLTNVTMTTYDADDRTSSVTSGYGSSSATTTSYTYDIVPTSCPSAPTGTTYCTQVENGLSQVTTDYFNPLDQTIEEAPPNTSDQTITTDTYDGVGNLLTQTNGSGTTTYGYDHDNKVDSISYSSGETAVAYYYNPDGNRTEMTDATGTTTYTYDPLQRLQSVTDDGGSKTVTYSYDPAGNTTCLSYPNSGSTTCQNAMSGTGLVAYTYDGLNRVTQMVDWVTPTDPTTFSYDNDSNLRTTVFPTSTATTATEIYDDADALVSTDFNTLGRNADELIGSTTPTGGSTEDYGYDSLNRVTTGTNAGATSTIGYGHDGASELTSVTPSGGSTTDYSYNADGQLCWTASTSASCGGSAPTGATTYTVNTTGERTASTPSGGNPTTYGWEQSGALTCETAASSTYSCGGTTSPSVTSTYTYNGDGLRMSDTPAGGSAQQFTWDVSESVPQLLEDGTNDYLYGPNISSAPIEQISMSSNTPSFLLSDTTGVREQVNSSGSATGSMSYDTYGNRCSSCSISTPFGFEGGYTDATGLVYLINRYYDPDTEQFLSVDPAIDVTETPYAFTSGDPINGLDPNGLGGSLLNPCNWGNACHHVNDALNDVGTSTFGHDLVDVPQDLFYLQYWGTYEVIGHTQQLGSHLGVIGCIAADVVTAPLVPFEAEGLGGQALGSLAKGQTVWLEGVPEQQPLIGNQVVFGVHFRQLNRDLGLPFLTFPGFNQSDHQVQFNW